MADEKDGKALDGAADGAQTSSKEPPTEASTARSTLFEFTSIRYPKLQVWDHGSSQIVAEFVPDSEADLVGDPVSGLQVRPGRFETYDRKVAKLVAACEGVKGASKAARDLIAAK